VVAGRNLLLDDTLRELVINETCSRTLGFTRPEKALGQFLTLGDKPIPIVGVVADFHETSYHDPIEPLVIGHSPDDERCLGIQLATKGVPEANVQAILAEMGKIWKGIYPNSEFGYFFIDEALASFYEAEQKTSLLMKAAMMITIFISCLGLFGLALFTAQRKTKEIGIRKIIVASVADIVTLLCKDFVMPVCIAILIASPVAWWLMNRWLEGFADRLPMLTVSAQAIKAALANPAKSLRTE
jgi:putative ABC transport system permease protein